MSLELIVFFAIGFLSWFLGSVAAGGAGLIFFIGASFFLPLSSIPIILAVVGSISGVYRLYLYRASINFDIAKWLLGGTVPGTIIGTNVFASLLQESQIYIIELILAIILVSSGLYGLFKSGIAKFNARNIYFLPFSFITSIISSIIGVGSPLINVLFQKTELSPVEIVGTKSFSNFILQFSKLILYAIVLDYETVAKSASSLALSDFLTILAIASMGAIAGSYYSRKYLDRLDVKKFNWIINTSLIIFGFYFLMQSIM